MLSLSCSLVADVVLFNSYFNMTSFLNSVDSYLNFIPDYKPQGIVEQIRPKCSVLFFPLQLPLLLKCEEGESIASTKCTQVPRGNLDNDQQVAVETETCVVPVPCVLSMPCKSDEKGTLSAVFVESDNLLCGMIM